MVVPWTWGLIPTLCGQVEAVVLLRCTHLDWAESFFPSTLSEEIAHRQIR